MDARRRALRTTVAVVAVAAGALGVGLLSARWTASAAARAGGATTAAGDLGEGGAIWKQDCAFCHGPRGEGTFQGPPIDHAGTASVDFMVRTGRMPISFRVGVPDEEPAKDRSYTDEQIRSLVAYTADFVVGPSVPAPPDVAGADVAAGGELYRLNCAACHQMAGSGGALAYGTVGPPLHDSSPVEVVEAMRTGPGSMPVFPPAVLDDEETANIAAYVEYLRSPDDRGGLDLWHLGPVPEGLIAWIVGVGGAVLLCRWLGEREQAPS